MSPSKPCLYPNRHPADQILQGVALPRLIIKETLKEAGE